MSGRKAYSKKLTPWKEAKGLLSAQEMTDCLSEAKALSGECLSLAVRLRKKIPIRPLLFSFKLILEAFFKHGSIDEMSAFIKQLKPIVPMETGLTAKEFKKCIINTMEVWIKTSSRHPKFLAFGCRYLAKPICGFEATSK